MKTAYFNRFSLSMSLAQAQCAGGQGDCLESVQALLRNEAITSQLDAIAPDDIAHELAEYGAWDASELEDTQVNRERIVWIAAGNIRDEEHSSQD